MSLEFARFRDITEYSTNAMLISNKNPTATLRSGIAMPHSDLGLSVMSCGMRRLRRLAIVDANIVKNIDLTA